MRPLCQWVYFGVEAIECAAPASHRTKGTGATLCEFHAVDYKETFGRDALKAIPEPVCVINSNIVFDNATLPNPR